MYAGVWNKAESNGAIRDEGALWLLIIPATAHVDFKKKLLFPST